MKSTEEREGKRREEKGREGKREEKGREERREGKREERENQPSFVIVKGSVNEGKKQRETNLTHCLHIFMHVKQAC